MVVQSSFTFQSNDDSEIFVRKWMDENERKPQAIVQIAHGLAEHITRYDPFARELVSQNIFVYGNDHRGHGETARKTNSIIYFADEHGFEKVVQDMHTLTTIIKREYPQTPIFLFGHSMGSFLSRRYIQLFGDKLAGVILCGTGDFAGIKMKIGKMAAHIVGKKHGRKTPSPLLYKLTLGTFNKPFQPNRTALDWLSRDEKEVDKYVEDRLCGGVPSAGFFYDYFTGMLMLNNPQHLNSIPSTLPIFLISGTKDPVGGKNGTGVLKTYHSYKQAGIKDVSYTLYKDARHEILNETNKDEVYRDVITWINNQITNPTDEHPCNEKSASRHLASL